jgi:YHS domain-containing protein
MSPQKTKPIRAFTKALFLCLALTGWSGPARAVTSDLVVSDLNTGLALYGFDPVAFFVDHAARRGSAAFEFDRAGSVWRFCNEGNRAAFAANPKIYTPRFGGYDPLAVARGSPTPGLPEFFVVRDSRLFLFSSEPSRARFLVHPQEAIAAAETAWPKVVRGLVH